MNLSTANLRIDEATISAKIDVHEDHIVYVKKGHGKIKTTKPLGAVRLELALDESGLTQAEIAEKANITQPTISRMIKGKNHGKYTIEVANVLGVSADWLSGLEYDPDKNPKLIENILSYKQNEFYIVDEYVNAHNKDLKTAHKNSKIMIHSAIVKDRDPKSLKFFVSSDQSMSPDINPGSFVTFCTTETYINNGSYYAVQLGEQECVRKVFVQPDRSILIRAKNEDYPDYTIKPYDRTVKILGKVISVTNQY